MSNINNSKSTSDVPHKAVVAASGSGQLDVLPQRDGNSDVDPSLAHDEATSDAPKKAASDAPPQRDRNSEVDPSLLPNEPVSDAPKMTADTDACIQTNTPPLPTETESDAGLFLPLATYHPHQSKPFP